MSAGGPGAGAVDGGRANLREFDGDAGLGAPQDIGSGVGAVAPRSGHRGDARGQRGARPGARAGRRGGDRVADGRASRLLRTAHDRHPQFSGATGQQAAEVFADQLAAGRVDR